MLISHYVDMGSQVSGDSATRSFHATFTCAPHQSIRARRIASHTDTKRIHRCQTVTSLRFTALARLVMELGSDGIILLDTQTVSVHSGHVET